MPDTLCVCVLYPLQVTNVLNLFISHVPFDNLYWKKEHSLKPSQSCRFTGELADTWPSMTVHHATGHYQAEAKLALPNEDQVTSRNNFVLPLPSNHKFSWQLLELNNICEFSSSLSCGWNWPEFLWGQEGEERENERENRAKNNNVWIFPGHLSCNVRNVMHRIPFFFPTKDTE